MSATVYTFPTASRSPRSRARNTPTTDAPARVKETVVGVTSSITPVASLDEKREAGRRLADLQAAKARAERDRAWGRADAIQACINANVRRAQRDAAACLYGHDDGPPTAA